MKIVLGLTLAMPLAKKADRDEYWATEPILHTPYFSSVMPRNQYRIIYRFLRFSDPDIVQPGNRNSWLIQLDVEIHSLCCAYQPFLALLLDETMLHYEGQLAFRMFIRTKRARFGINIFMLCDCYGAGTVFEVHEFGAQSLTKIELIVVHLLKRAGMLEKYVAQLLWITGTQVCILLNICIWGKSLLQVQ